MPKETVLTPELNVSFDTSLVLDTEFVQRCHYSGLSLWPLGEKTSRKVLQKCYFLMTITSFTWFRGSSEKRQQSGQTRGAVRERGRRAECLALIERDKQVHRVCHKQCDHIWYTSWNTKKTIDTFVVILLHRQWALKNTKWPKI